MNCLEPCPDYPCPIISELLKAEQKIPFLLNSSPTLDCLDNQSRKQLRCNACKLEIIIQEIEDGKAEHLYANKEVIMLCELHTVIRLTYLYGRTPDTFQRGWWSTIKKWLKRK